VQQQDVHLVASAGVRELLREGNEAIGVVDLTMPQRRGGRNQLRAGGHQKDSRRGTHQEFVPATGSSAGLAVPGLILAGLILVRADES